jgi:hypothetical protein
VVNVILLHRFSENFRYSTNGFPMANYPIMQGCGVYLTVQQGCKAHLTIDRCCTVGV